MEVFVTIPVMALSKATQPLSTTQISEIISKKSRGEIFELSSTLRDSLEYRLKRDGYVEGVDIMKKSLCSITPKEESCSKVGLLFYLPIPKAITDYICLQITELVHRMTIRLLEKGIYKHNNKLQMQG
jgi:hypothetical protein